MQGNLNSNTENYLTKNSIGVPEYKPKDEFFKEKDFSDKKPSGYKREKVSVNDALEELEDESPLELNDFDDGLTDEEFKFSLERELEKQLSENDSSSEMPNGHFQDALKNALEKEKVENEPKEKETPEDNTDENENENENVNEVLGGATNDETEVVPVEGTLEGELVSADIESLSEQSPQSPEREEYLRLKQEFKQTQKKYLDAVAEDYTTRDHVSKLLGIGRHNMSDSTKEAHDRYLSANRAFYEYSRDSESFRVIAERAERMNRVNHHDAESFSIEPSLVGRHILNTAEKRLKLQTSRLMPERLSQTLGRVSGLIKNHPRIAITAGVVALGVGGAVAGAGAVGLYAGKVGLGFATRYGGSMIANKTLLQNKESKLKEITDQAIGVLGQMDEETLERYEEEILRASNTVQKTKTGIKIASRMAGIGVAGAAFSPEINDFLTDAPDNLPTGDGGAGLGLVPPEAPVNPTDVIPESPVVPEGQSTELPVQEKAPLSEVAKGWVESESMQTPSSVEMEILHDVKEGDTLSKVVFDEVEKRLTAGSASLPDRAMGNGGLMSFMLEKFPEFSNGTDISPTLSPEQWQRLGVSSGNPHMIFYDNDVVNVDAIIKIMEGQPVKEVLDSLPELENASQISESTSMFSGNENNLTLEEAEEFAPKYASDQIIDAPKSFEVSSEPEPVIPLEASPEPEAVPSVESPVSNEVIHDLPTSQESINESSEYGPYETNDVDNASVESAFEDFDNAGYFVGEYYQGMTHTFDGETGLLTLLSDTIKEGLYQRGDLAPPMRLVSGDNDFLGDIDGYLYQGLLELSGGVASSDYVFFPEGTVLNPEDWEVFGITSDNPMKPNAGDEFEVGKFLEFMLGGNNEVLLNNE
ncbi:hypothetical protein H6781_01745 [Candidatus Nomurabacteria bacterium]|nr:hypothetical protein [Candidatus Nomurabacteria bacterium]MCB9818488.1 hypothetical protein [Candidatus Nomurabacteria bacterium]